MGAGKRLEQQLQQRQLRPMVKPHLEETAPGVQGRHQAATLDPVRGYAKAIHDEFPDAVQVLGAFHVVKPATMMVDELRRRVQQATIGHRGRKSEARRRGHLPLLMSVEGPFSKSEDTNEPGEPRPC